MARQSFQQLGIPQLLIRASIQPDRKLGYIVEMQYYHDLNNPTSKLPLGQYHEPEALQLAVKLFKQVNISKSAVSSQHGGTYNVHFFNINTMKKTDTVGWGNKGVTALDKMDSHNPAHVKEFIEKLYKATRAMGCMLTISYYPPGSYQQVWSPINSKNDLQSVLNFALR